MLRDCGRIRLTAACQQLRTRTCTDLHLALYCFTDPIVESSSRVTFAPWDVAFAGLPALFTQARLDPVRLCLLMLTP